MSTAIAAALQALDGHPVSYETTATDTIIEADAVDQLFAAVQAAHQAIPEDRVITSVEIDEDRRRPQDMHQRVASVERQLGHPPRKESQQPNAGQGPRQSQAVHQPAPSTQQAGQPMPQQAQPTRVQSTQNQLPSQDQPPAQNQPPAQTTQTGQQRSPPQY